MSDPVQQQQQGDGQQQQGQQQQQQQPADAPWFKSIFADDGTFVDSWQSRLPDTMKEHGGMLANFRDMPTMVKALSDNITAARSKPSGLVPPPADAPEEAKQAFAAELRKLNGVPEKPEDYKFTAPAKLPQGVAFDEKSVAESFAPIAHKLGLTPAQAQALVEYDVERMEGLNQQLAAQQAQQVELLANEQKHMIKLWGAQVDQNLMTAKRVALTLNIPEAQNLFDPKHPMFAGVDMADAFVRMGKIMGEKSLVTGAAVNNMDPETMARDIMTNPNNPDYEAYNNASHPGAAAARAKVADLWKRSTNGQ